MNCSASESLMQLKAAKTTIELLRSDTSKAAQALNAMSRELDKSRSRVNFLEGLVNKYRTSTNSYIMGQDLEAHETEEDMKHEIEQLRLSLQAAEARYNEAQAWRIASTMVKEIESNASEREAELESELRKSRYVIEELNGKLIGRENELLGISEENNDLSSRLESALSGLRVQELEKELQDTKARFETLATQSTEKEIKYQTTLNENKTLKSELKAKNASISNQRDALLKLGTLEEELDKCNKKLARVSEQFDAAQATVLDMEAELRKLKVQSDQYRKAAEMATTMLLAGNDPRLVERTGSMDRSYISPRTQRIISSVCTNDYIEEEEELIKSKYANMLRRVGILWKKTYK